MTSKITYIIVFVILLFVVAFVASKNFQTKVSTDTPKIQQVMVSYHEIESKLITEKVTDDLPTNSLEIPKEKWGEKLPALAQRVLQFLYDQKVIKQLPPQDKLEDYQAFLKAWGKPWRVHYLKTDFDKEELQLIWDQLLLVQANTPEELEKQKQIVISTLKKVEPTPELPEDTDLSTHFSTQQDIDKSIKEGRLIEIKTANIKISDQAYVIGKLADALNKEIDPRLASHKEVLEISSATRFLKLQTLLKEKLGYLASKISYHTKGAAVDLKLSSDAKKRFDEYLKQKIGNTTRFDQITFLNQKLVPLTVSNLIKNGILENGNELAQVYNILEQSTKGIPIEIIDETFFGVRLSKEGKVTEINPTFHLQYNQ